MFAFNNRFYILGGEDNAQLSEVESDGEPEDTLTGDNETNSNKNRKRKGKTHQKGNKKTKIEETTEETKELTEEEQKKKTDSLWADFLKETDFKPKPKPKVVTNNEETTKPKKEIEKTIENPKSAIIFEFAGEKVDSEGNVIEKNENKIQIPTVSKKTGGLGSVLSQIGKKQKIGTLEKSKIDWDRFKRDENISDELKAHNMGKNGYLDRQDFLQRADLRQFELEKEARAIRRTHRS